MVVYIGEESAFHAAYIDDAKQFKGSECFSDTLPADIQLILQVPLARQLFANLDIFGFHQVVDLFYDMFQTRSFFHSPPVITASVLTHSGRPLPDPL